jgi:hypothetical protein
MGCQECADLLFTYQLAVKLYTKSVWNLSGWAGDDFRLAVEQSKRLRLECQEAHDVLVKHWRQKHITLNHKAASP